MGANNAANQIYCFHLFLPFFILFTKRIMNISLKSQIESRDSNDDGDAFGSCYYPNESKRWNVFISSNFITRAKQCQLTWKIIFDVRSNAQTKWNYVLPSHLNESRELLRSVECNVFLFFYFYFFSRNATQFNPMTNSWILYRLWLFDVRCMYLATNV